MPTTLPERRPIRCDRRREFALFGLLAVELVTVGIAGASAGTKGVDASRWFIAPTTLTCTAVEVPCHLLAP